MCFLRWALSARATGAASSPLSANATWRTCEGRAWGGSLSRPPRFKSGSRRDLRVLRQLKENTGPLSSSGPSSSGPLERRALSRPDSISLERGAAPSQERAVPHLSREVPHSRESGDTRELEVSRLPSLSKREWTPFSSRDTHVSERSKHSKKMEVLVTPHTRVSRPARDDGGEKGDVFSPFSRLLISSRVFTQFPLIVWDESSSLVEFSKR